MILLVTTHFGTQSGIYLGTQLGTHLPIGNPPPTPQPPTPNIIELSIGVCLNTIIIIRNVDEYHIFNLYWLGQKSATSTNKS